MRKFEAGELELRAKTCVKFLNDALSFNGGEIISVLLFDSCEPRIKQAILDEFTKNKQSHNISFFKAITTDPNISYYYIDLKISNPKVAEQLNSQFRRMYVQEKSEKCIRLLETMLSINYNQADLILNALSSEDVRRQVYSSFTNRGYEVNYYNFENTMTGVEIKKSGGLIRQQPTFTRAARASFSSTTHVYGKQIGQK